MSTDTPARPQMTADQRFAQRVDAMAKRQCARLLGTERGQQAAQRITMAILGAMQSARNPQAFHDSTDLSLADCIALSAQTGLLPGGPNPTVYLVPQAARRGEPPALQWRITHRGLCVLAYRAGFALRAVPVHVDDHLTVSLGEVVDHSGAAESWPESLAELRGVAVIVRDLARGQDVIRAWVPAVVIDRRRRVSRDGSVWDAWPIEMAQKTAIKYAFARGSVPVDSPELSEALAGDSRADVIDTQAEAAPPRVSRIPSAAALPDHGEAPDYAAEVASMRQPDPAPVARQADPQQAAVSTLSRDEIKAQIARIETALGQSVYWPIRTRMELPLEQSVAALRHAPAVLEEYLSALQGAADARAAALDADEAGEE